jgi:hypothetical protein
MNTLGVITTIVAFIAFAGIAIWAYTRSSAETEADARLWMDDEK